MSEFETDEVTVQDELTTLKDRANLLGLTYHPSISAGKLREKIAKAMEEGPAEQEDAPKKTPEAVEETVAQKRVRMKQNALALKRIRLTCMNPAKAEWDGEIFVAGNSLIGSIKKFVPFNADDGWHVPNIILQMLRERQCQIFVSAKDARGNNVRKGKMIKEFAIEELDPLTPEELAELARRQAMAKSID